MDGINERPEQAASPDGEWQEAYEALVLETFDADEAVLLLKLLEKPDLLREALEYFAGGGENEEVAEDA